MQTLNINNIPVLLSKNSENKFKKKFFKKLKF